MASPTLATASETIVSHVVPGVDCTSVPVSTFTLRGNPEPDEHAWSSVLAPRRVREVDLRWFDRPRSAHEGLSLLFGEQWRIDFLPTVSDGDRFALLTHRQFGGRLMVRLTELPNGWCGDPSTPVGADLTDNPPSPEAEFRRDWLLGRAYSAVDTEDLRSLITAMGIRPEQPRPAPGDDLELSWLLCVGLIEVWLAEHGYTGASAEAIRTMVALTGLTALDAYGWGASTTSA